MAAILLIRGARIIDGTGAPWFAGDVRLRDGRIRDRAARCRRMAPKRSMRTGAIWRPASSTRIATTT